MRHKSIFQVMAKPIGPVCNLTCHYCYYLEKQNLYPQQTDFRMPPKILERFIASYIQSQDTPEILFVWQGGEPTLLGVDYFRRIMAFQEQFANGKTIKNSLQTNGTLLDDGWGAFLAENGFLVGISIDGDRKLHDTYRRDRHSRPSFAEVIKGVEVLKKHDVQFNTLTVVSYKNSYHGRRVYRFLKDIGSTHLQFIPIVERKPDRTARALGLALSCPPLREKEQAEPLLTEWSVRPKQYGVFLTDIFMDWVHNDVSSVFVHNFEELLACWCGWEPALCAFSRTCGNAMVIEHNGDVYSCDHYVYPEYKIGNVMEQSIQEMALSARQQAFGRVKRDALPKYCRECEVRFACRGECPKYRFLKTPDGEAGLNYLCEGYKYFLKKIDPYMKSLAQWVREGKGDWNQATKISSG